MAEVQKYSTTEKLKEADQNLMGSPSLLGMTMLTYISYINSNRSQMFTSHTKQLLTLDDPDIPYVFTNNENIVGKYSSGYKKAKDNLVVHKKVFKYKDLIDEPFTYTMFVRNEDTNEFDVVERSFCEDLTENFGYKYVNDVIDSLKEGDVIKKGDVLYKSTSYDEDMNYGYGKNLVVAYTLDPPTSEDAAEIRRGAAESLTSIETETIVIPLNSNDFMLNIYGNKNEYNHLPDLGSVISDKMVVTRRQFNNQLLFDFKDSTLREILESDSIYYIDKNVKVIDIDIYNNNEERIDSPFYDQINEYLDAQNEYYQEIYNTCAEIMESGFKYSGDIEYLYKRAGEMLDTKKKWKSAKDNVFGNMEIHITICRENVPVAKGSKITGRFGNKSVISVIREDDEMPYTKDGRRVDLLINLLAIINRTTAMVLFEMFMNGSSYQVRQKMKSLETLEEKEKLLFDYLGTWNPKQSKEFYSKYKKLGKKAKEAYINDAIEDGIYIHQPAMWEDEPLFYRCIKVLDKFPFIGENKLYIKKWGREYPVLTNYFLGESHFVKLKQSDRRGFSARSTGALDTKSLPTRSFKNKSHTERLSSTCVRFGEFETNNFSTAVPSEELALFHALYRTSIKGRRDIISLMFTDETDISHKIDKSYTSRVAEIFNVILKSLGIKLDFVEESDDILVLNDDVIREYTIGEDTFLCTEYQYEVLKKIGEIREEILDEKAVITEEGLMDEIEKRLRKLSYIDDTMLQEIGQGLMDVVRRDNKNVYDKLIEKFAAIEIPEDKLFEGTDDDVAIIIGE